MSVVVLDFDGTMTHAEREGVPFVAGYLADLCALVGRPADDPEVALIVETTLANIKATPEAFPFEWQGRAVAPAAVDPYLRMVPVAHAIFDHFGAFANADDRGRLLGTVLYKYNYQKTSPAFRPDAAEFLSRLASSPHPTWIVTNSDTDAVRGKLKRLGEQAPGVLPLVDRVHGYARKFDIDPSWEGVAPALHLPGLARDVLLRRHTYFSILVKLLAAEATDFQDLIVIGDIFELDLAMPLALGARVGLVASDHTPAYERAFVEAHPRATLLHQLADAWAFVNTAST